MSLIENYARNDIAFVKGSGSWLFDEKGNSYLDMIGGLAVCSLGHCNDTVVKAIKQQSEKLLHTSNLYRIPSQEKLGAKLCKLANLQKAFFCNSGSEANEAAIKLIRIYAQTRQISNPKIVVFENSFHGRTLGSLSASDNKFGRQGFEPLFDDFVFLKLNDTSALQKVFVQQNIAGVFVEPIQGEGGIYICNDDFLVTVRKLCDQHHALFVADEIQCGMGRTGLWFAHQSAKVVPDIMTLAKSLGNGFPIGCMLTTSELASLLVPGKHGSTFGGNPLASVAGLAVIEATEKNEAMTKGKIIADYLVETLIAELKHHNVFDLVKDIRYKGCMIGIELKHNCQSLVKLCLEKGLLINVTRNNIIRLLPSLLLSHKEAKLAINILVPLIKKL